MKIEMSSAVQVLQSLDRQLVETTGVPKKRVEELLTDTVERGGGPALERQSEAFRRLAGELGTQLKPLLAAIGEAAERQGGLQHLFADPNAEDGVRQRAQELLEGYFNAENTGNRLFDFAFSFYIEGEDREAFARARQKDIHEGFRQAEKILGGLAEVSLETRAYIDQRIEDFIDEDNHPPHPQPRDERG